MPLSPRAYGREASRFPNSLWCVKRFWELRATVPAWGSLFWGGSGCCLWDCRVTWEYGKASVDQQHKYKSRARARWGQCAKWEDHELPWKRTDASSYTSLRSFSSQWNENREHPKVRLDNCSLEKMSKDKRPMHRSDGSPQPHFKTLSKLLPLIWENEGKGPAPLLGRMREKENM